MKTPTTTSQTTPTITVDVVHPATVGGGVLQVSGYTQAYTETPVFAQTSGYLTKWNFDIGGRVHANDVLGEIDTPEVDQELAEAQAQLEVAKAAANLAEVTYQRDQTLFNQKVLDAETRDSAADTFAEDQATVVADGANLDRLNALEAFEVLRAPFDGIVTARNVDVGTYVANGSGNQLFVVDQISPLRIYVQVPQAYSQLVKVGMKADLTLPGFPGRTFQAQVTNTADVVDPASRSLLTELQIPNASGELLPGAYAQITLKFTGTSPYLTVPENTLIFRREGAAVGVVDANGKVEIRPITINQDLGTKLEVSRGLSTSDQVILDPSDSLANGMMARIAQPASKSK
ncbi:MAG TPA: efflux RND transporter periplasmic adaptor subunit [Chthoniobacterales bacterium]|nr:efflux RND transporter periplasmic adaptor subunit [Chthoniobacterales bacterium]